MLQRVEAITAYADTWGALDLAPLRVTLHLANPRAGYDALHLDGMLSYGLVVRAMGRAALPDSVVPYDLPLPLRCLWRDGQGLPLWAVTDMSPQGSTAVASATWMRRPISPASVALPDGRPYTFREMQGPYKAMQIPLPIEAAQRWECDVVGDAHHMADLLAVLQSVGKKAAQGWGRIVEWHLDPIPAWQISAEGLLRRTVPIEALGADPLRGQLLGWSPPYWRNQTLCLAAGEATRVPKGWG